MTPHMLINTDHLHRVEPGRVLDQDPLAFGEDGGVGGVPRHAQALSDPGHAQVRDHDPFQRPPQPTSRQLGPRLRRRRGVLAPDMTTTDAAVAAHRDQQCCRTPPERFMRQPTDQAVPRHPLAAAAPTPLVRVADPTRQDCPARLKALPEHDQAELVEAGKCGQVRGREGSDPSISVKSGTTWRGSS